MNSPVILISDDEPLIVSSLTRLAKREGLSIVSDTTSDRVLELARRHRPDAIILDVNQRVDGRDLLARLKSDPETKDLRVIVLSAMDDQYVRQVCLELGAEDYQLKPFDSIFMRKVARMVGGATSAGAPPSVIS